MPGGYVPKVVIRFSITSEEPCALKLYAVLRWCQEEIYIYIENVYIEREIYIYT